MFKRYVLFDVRIEDPKLHSHTPILDELGLYIQFPSLIVHSFKNFFWLNRELYSPYQKWTKHAEASSSCLPICLPCLQRRRLLSRFTIYLASVPLRRNNNPHWKCSQSDFVCFTCLQQFVSLYLSSKSLSWISLFEIHRTLILLSKAICVFSASSFLSCKLVPVHYREQGRGRR